MLMVLGVFSGSAAWWLCLAVTTSLFRKRVSPNLMTWVNRFAGGIILLFGIMTLSRPFLH